MGMMDVADVETGAFAADTAGTKRRERTLMAELRQRVGLVNLKSESYQDTDMQLSRRRLLLRQLSVRLRARGC